MLDSTNQFLHLGSLTASEQKMMEAIDQAKSSQISEEPSDLFNIKDLLGGDNHMLLRGG